MFTFLKIMCSTALFHPPHQETCITLSLSLSASLPPSLPRSARQVLVETSGICECKIWYPRLAVVPLGFFLGLRRFHQSKKICHKFDGFATERQTCLLEGLAVLWGLRCRTWPSAKALSLPNTPAIYKTPIDRWKQMGQCRHIPYMEYGTPAN